MKIKPPTDIPADVLFRNMVATPRPKEILNFRIANAPNVAFYVQAIGSQEIAEVSGLDAGLISKCIVTKGDKPAFSSVESIKKILSVAEYELLVREMHKVLARISPAFNYCDSDEWMARLVEGAKHSSNYLLTKSLGDCYELIIAPNGVWLAQDRPERYFGVPRCKLLDCHWMAYLAAKEIMFPKQNDEKAFVESAKREQNPDTPTVKEIPTRKPKRINK